MGRFLTFFALLASSGLQAQQQPFLTKADDPTWSVLHCIYGIGVGCDTYQYQYLDTMTVCGRQYSSLLATGSEPLGTMFVRNDGQRTLFRMGGDCSRKEYLMYDFSLELGDSTYCGMNMGSWMDLDTALFVVDAIDTVDVSGTDRKRYTMRFSNCNDDWVGAQMEWIEGLGSTTHSFYPIACICDFCESGYQTLCVDSAEVSLYRSSLGDVCDTAYVITNVNNLERANLGFPAFQDMVTNELVVQVGSGSFWNGVGDIQIDLVGLDGRTRQLRSTPSSSDHEWRTPLPWVATGIYLVRLTNAAGVTMGQRVYIQQRW
jgi:hypothetical protein